MHDYASNKDTYEVIRRTVTRSVTRCNIKYWGGREGERDMVSHCVGIIAIILLHL
jgi:hypothetical protein